MSLGDDLAFLATESGKPFAIKVAQEIAKFDDLNGDSNIFVQSTTTQFANTERLPNIEGSVRGKNTFVFVDSDNHSNNKSSADNLMDFKLLLNTAKNSAAIVNAVMPIPPYSRQDVAKGNQPVTLAEVIRDVEKSMGHNRGDILVNDIHNRATLAYPVGKPMLNLFSSRIINPYLIEHFDLQNSVFLSPDAGGLKRVEYYADLHGVDYGFIYKRRDYTKPNECYAVGYYGAPLLNKDVIIFDDMFDTGTSAINAVLIANDYKAKNVNLMIPHMLCNTKIVIDPVTAKERLWDPDVELQRLYDNGTLAQVYGTDSVLNGRVNLNDKSYFTGLSIAPLYARVILNLHQGVSISEFLE